MFTEMFQPTRFPVQKKHDRIINKNYIYSILGLNIENVLPNYSEI